MLIWLPWEGGQVRGQGCPLSWLACAHLPTHHAALAVTCSSTSGRLSVGRNTSPRWLSECSS